jgi:quinoprotein glucose dehydrogenase
MKLSRFLLLSALLCSPPARCQHKENHDWPVWGGGPENMHYSRLAQINRGNVKRLAAVWTFDTGEQGGLQTSPLIVGNVLYGITPTQKVFALDAANGKLLWKFDSGIKGTQPDRGLAFWSSGKDHRILVGIMNFLYALDAATGTPIAAFGQNGRIDLRRDLGRDPDRQSIALTSPGIVYKDLIIVGGRNPETLPAPPGDIRAYDVRTGQLRWAFHTIPHPGEFGYETWPADAWKTSGAANNWAGMALDKQRGIVFVPTGSAAFDFYGADRVGDDLFANSLIALNAETGERYGISRASGTISGTKTFPPLPCWSPSSTMETMWTPWHRLPSKVSCIYLSEPPASRFFPSSITNTRQAPFRVKSPRASSLFPPSLPPSRVNSSRKIC